MSNGVKQGSVISPLFFTLYVDELIQTFGKSRYGCKLGAKYYGILVYADDIFLLSPSFYGLPKMLNMCNMFAEDKGLHFNARKTKCIAFHKKHEQLVTEQCTMVLNGDNIKWFSDIVHLVIIMEILDYINGIYESNLNEEENIFLLNDLCTL